MRFARVRSGLIETTHAASTVAVDAGGHVLYSSGDVDRPLFYRSAIKPFQALAARRTGLDLPPEHLAITCASHSGGETVTNSNPATQKAGIFSRSLR